MKSTLQICLALGTVSLGCALDREVNDECYEVGECDLPLVYDEDLEEVVIDDDVIRDAGDETFIDRDALREAYRATQIDDDVVRTTGHVAHGASGVGGLTTEPPGPAIGHVLCEDEEHHAGDRWKVECNTCMCSGNSQIYCTLQACGPSAPRPGVVADIR